VGREIAQGAFSGEVGTGSPQKMRQMRRIPSLSLIQAAAHNELTMIQFNDSSRAGIGRTGMEGRYVG
jgi:hypothetical protein